MNLAGGSIDAQDQRTVAVAVRRYHGLHRAIWQKRLNGRERIGVDILGVDRDERVAAPGGYDFRAERPQQVEQEITADGGVLIQHDAHAVERSPVEKLAVTAAIFA